jgi:hypothetical protein
VGDELSAAAKNVVGYAETISKTLVVGGSVAVAAIAARALGSDEIKVGPINLPVGYTALVIGLGTLAHAFWSSHILTTLSEFYDVERKAARQKFRLEHPDMKPTYTVSDKPELDVLNNRYFDALLEYGDSTQKLFDEIRTQKGLFLRGLVPRTLREGSRIARMSWSDPTTLLSYGLALLIIVAILPWRYDNGVRWASPKMIIAYAAIALILVITNWFAGGLWIISVSRLTEDAGANLGSLYSSRKLLRLIRTTATFIALIIVAVMLIPNNLVAILGVVAIVGVILVALLSFKVSGMSSA